MKVRKGSLSEFVLLALEKAVDGYVRVDDFINNPRRYAFGNPESLKKSSLAEALRRLRVGGLVEKDINEGDVIYKLTTLGKVSIFPRFEEKHWDGKYRIVVFDIPENKRVVRDLFRRRLKNWGFIVWQKSVWVTRNNITQKLRDLIRELKIEDWVAVIESSDPVLKHIIFNDR